MAAWAAGFLAIFLVLGWIVAASDSFQSCLAGDTDDLDDASFIRSVADNVSVPTTLQCVGDFLDQNEPTILALTAIAVTFFGFGVWSAGRRLQRAALVLAAAAEDSSRLRLRAQVGLHAIEPSPEAAQNSVLITVKNFGMTAAPQVRIAAQFASEPPDGAGGRDIPDTGALLALFSGQAVTIPLAPGEAISESPRSIYVVGYVRYADVYGQNWRTNFCWVWQSAVARFVPHGPHNDAISET